MKEKYLSCFWLSFYFDANNLPNTEQAVKTQPKQDKSFSWIFHRFWPFICCLNVVLWLDKGYFSWKFAHFVRFKINKRSFEPFCVWILLSLTYLPWTVTVWDLCSGQIESADNTDERFRLELAFMKSKVKQFCRVSGVQGLSFLGALSWRTLVTLVTAVTSHPFSPQAPSLPPFLCRSFVTGYPHSRLKMISRSY